MAPMFIKRWLKGGLLGVMLLLFLGIGFKYLSVHPIPLDQREAYLTASQPGIEIVPILSVGQSLANGYRMAGIPDGLGALDNGDGTLTLLMHHEIAPNRGKKRSHGARGAFISRWIITLPGHPSGDWQVLSGEDAIHSLFLWDPATQRYQRSPNENLGRLCSADLPVPSSLYFARENLGTLERLFLGGEEMDPPDDPRYGRAFATVLTGPQAGKTFELPRMGQMAFENVVASPFSQRKTVVVLLDDASGKTMDTLGEVYVYVGEKQREGALLNRAGLTQGVLYGVAVENLPLEDPSHGLGAQIREARFSLAGLKDLSGDDGRRLFELTKAHNELGITKFFRPEDGAWHPQGPGLFYFVTTGAAFKISDDDETIHKGPGRLWQIRFDDIEEPEQGGMIRLLLDGTEGIIRPDNLTVTPQGQILIQEDPGLSRRLARIWQYDPQSGQLTDIAQHNPRYFSPTGDSWITMDEESSGIIDISSITGDNGFLAVTQSHISLHRWFNIFNRRLFNLSLSTGKEIVEDGQLMVILIE